jgi:Phosphorylase superfamily
MLVLVPQGAEYQAVRRGVRAISQSPLVLPIPVGIAPVQRWVAHWQQTPTFQAATQSGVMVMGLCGSLTPQFDIGDAVLYQHCLDASGHHWPCQTPLALPLVTAFTSDRLVHTAIAKQHLAQTYHADVVDMEGTAILSALVPLGIPVTMVRVVSDTATQDLPDLQDAISAEGNLRPFPLAIGLLRQPIAASRLIRGSLQGLRTLQRIATLLSDIKVVLE